MALRIAFLDFNVLLVNMSDGLAVVGTYDRVVFGRSLNNLLMNRNLILMCRAAGWFDKLWEYLTVAWLSHFTRIGMLCFGLRISVKSSDSHRASWHPTVKAMVFASIVDSATHGCFFEVQVIGAPDRYVIAPEIDTLSSWSPPQSESVKVVISNGFDPSIFSLYLYVAFKSFQTALRCWHSLMPNVVIFLARWFTS